MIEKLTGLLRMTARNLEELSGTTPSEGDQEEPEVQPTEDEPLEPATPQEDRPPPPSYWQRFATAEREHFGWLRRNPLVVGITLGLAVAIVFAEQWLLKAWDWLTTQARVYWPILASHPVALIAVGLALVYLIFGLNWLRYVDDFLRWIWRTVKERPRLSALVGGIVLIIVLWIANNYGTWSVLPFSVGQTESTPLNGETVAAQLIAELNQVGVGNPTPVLILWELQEPRTSSGRVTSCYRDRAVSPAAPNPSPSAVCLPARREVAWTWAIYPSGG
jgi:hypothetical protein